MNCDDHVYFMNHASSLYVKVFFEVRLEYDGDTLTNSLESRPCGEYTRFGIPLSLYLYVEVDHYKTR